jgi:DNA modification methylase
MDVLIDKKKGGNNMGRIVLKNEDCLEAMDRMIEKGIKVDAIMVDLPYGTTQNKWDSVIPFSPMWDRIKKLRKDNTPIIMFAQTPFDKALGYSNIKELKYEWIWEKTQATGHLNAKKMPMKAHENILVFYKKLPLYSPQKTTGHKPMNSGVRRSSLKNENYNDINKVDLPFGGDTDRYPRSVIKFKSDKQKYYLHPTQKPVALMEYLVKTYTNENELVLDFTMGSGTTGVACKNLNRDFIGIELDETYFNIAKDRIDGCIDR